MGPMTKCPKCGYDNLTGRIDPQYRAPLAKSRESQPAAPVNNSPVQRYPAGGLIAWSIITLLLFSRLCGIVGFCKALGINKCTTAEEQEAKINSAKIWCLVGTVGGVVIMLIMRLAQQ